MLTLVVGVSVHPSFDRPPGHFCSLVLTLVVGLSVHPSFLIVAAVLRSLRPEACACLTSSSLLNLAVTLFLVIPLAPE